MARQLVKSGVDTGKMAMAGMAQNYEGEAIAAVGAVIGEAFETASGNKDTIDKQLKEESEIFGKALEGQYDEPTFDTGDDEIVDPNDVEVLDENDIDLFPDEDLDGNFPPIVSEKPETYSLDMFQSDFEAKQVAKGVAPEKAKSLALEERGKAEGWLMDTYGTLSPTAKQKKMKSGKTVYNKVSAEYDELSKQYVAGTAVPTKGSTTKGSAGVVTKRLMPGEEGSPFSRLAKVFDGSPKGRRRGSTRLSNEDTFNMLAGQTGSQLPTSEDKTFVPKQRYMRTPSWASGTSVGAAIEGWNIGVEADNYRNQLEADIKDSQEREWKGMVEEAKERSLEDQSLLAIFDSYKTEFANAQSLPTAEREKALQKIRGGVTQIEVAKKNLNDIQSKMKEMGPNVAYNMMSEEQTDEWLTIQKGGGEMGFFPGEDGEIYYMGSSRHKMPMKKKLSTLLDPESGILNVPMKADVYGVIDKIAEGVEKDKYMQKTVDADGIIREQPIPIEDLQRELDFEINQAIQQYGAKSLAANLPAFQGKGGYAKWKAGMKVDSDLAGNSMNVLKRNMVEALHHKLSGYQAQITEEESKAGLEDRKQRYRMQSSTQDAEEARRLEILKQSNPTKTRTGANKVNKTKDDYSNLARSFAEMIVNNNDPVDLQDRLNASAPEGTEFNYNPDSRNFTITTAGKTQTKTVTKDGEESTTETTTEGQDKMISFDRSIGDLTPVLQDLMYEYNLNLGSNQPSPDQVTKARIAKARAKNKGN